MGAYTIDEHRHRFAVWAAARATQRQFTTVARLRDAIEAAGVRQALSAPATRQVSPAAFDALHRVWCSRICRSLNEAAVAKVTYGRAAKLVAVYLKTVVVMSDACESSLGRNLHPPIDRTLLQALAASPLVPSPHKGEWRKTSWTQLDQSGYYRLVKQLRGALPKGAPFWRLEEFWQPSETPLEGWRRAYFRLK